MTNLKHGHNRSNSARSPTYNSWTAMLKRCNNPRNVNYKYYGAKGIKVCKRWLKFENFLADMEERPNGLTLDRKNNNGNYCKRNCKWATAFEQNNHHRSNVLLTVDGMTRNVQQWFVVTPHISRSKTTIQRRIGAGWSARDAIFTPARAKHSDA